MLFEEHDELFDGIARAVGAGVLQVPFDLVHADAHADIGCGQFRYVKHLLTDLMQRPTNQRSNPVRGERGLNRGTVVLFLAARGWLRSLTYVHHPDDGKDLPSVFLDYDLACDQLYFQLPRCGAGHLDDWMKLHISAERLGEICEYPPETRVPFDLIPIGDAVPNEYDFVALTRSPGFTPPKADALFDLIAQYIAPIA